MPLLPTSVTNARADAAMRGQTLLGSGDLRNIVAQDWGHRLLTLIGYRRFHQLLHEDAINEYLSQRCCLCAQWVGRSQEMHRHMRLFHAQFWPMVMAKSSQLSNLYATDSPCRFCRSVFKASHACNTWTQVSLLLIYGAGRLTDSSIPCTPALQCEICDQHMLTEEQLHQHLIADHNLTSARWNPSRDSIDGSSGCAHCGTVFSSMESLRSHIAQGRCSCFDPSLTCEPKPVSDQVLRALTQGGLTEALQDMHWRMQMTLHCQCCSQVCVRASDLMLHLRSSHPTIWQASTQLTALLTGMFYTAWGCICNPSTAAKRLNHICVPLKQLAMQFCRLPAPHVFCPLLVTEQMLARAYHPSIPRELKFAIDRAMIQHDFQILLSQTDLMKQLTRTCLICANTFTPTELGLHLREMHECSTALVSFFVQQLMHVMLESNPMGHACPHCDMIYDIPLHLQIADENDSTALSDRVILAQNHYKAHCPGTLQLAIVLCRIYNDGRLHHDRQHGCLTADPGNLPAVGTTHGREDRSRPHPGPQSRTTETSQKRRRTGQKDGQAGGGHGAATGDSHADGQDSGQTRPSLAGGPARNSLPFLFQQQGADRVTEMPCGSGGEVAPDGQPSAETKPVATSTSTLATGLAGGFADEADAAWGIRPPIPADEGGTNEQCSLAGHDMPLLGMGCPSEEAPCGSKAPNISQEDGGECAGADRDEHRAQPGAIVPHTSHNRGCHPMEAHHQHEGGQGILAPTQLVRVQHLGADGHQHEGPFTDPEQPYQATGTAAEPAAAEGQGEGKAEVTADVVSDPLLRSTLLDILSHATLANPDNWCFVNSTMMSFLWSTLSLMDFALHKWGMHCNALHEFVSNLETSMGILSTETWFNDVLQSWGRQQRDHHTDPLTQHDAAEFISSWLDQTDAPSLNMRWERRVEAEGIAHKVDESTATLPLFLQFTDVLRQLPRCSLTDLFRCWHQMDGMAAALLQPSQALCVHVDRCMRTHSQTVGRCETIIDPDADCVVPMFSTQHMQHEDIEYCCVALQAHLGSDLAGHYRTAVRVRPTITRGTMPCAWLLCDDGVPPQPLWTLPTWFLRNVTIFWLVRGDSHVLPEYAEAASAGDQPSAVEAMLALLPMPENP